MNGIFNNNFLIGFLLAKDLSRNEALTVGLASGMFPQNNMVGPLLLKPQIDTRIDLETKNTSLQGSLNNIQGELIKAKNELASLNRPLKVESRENGGVLNFTISGAETTTLKFKNENAKNGYEITDDKNLNTSKGSGRVDLVITTDDGFKREFTFEKKVPPVS